jgi:uncharacterized RDD family membrane protein YckC
MMSNTHLRVAGVRKKLRWHRRPGRPRPGAAARDHQSVEVIRMHARPSPGWRRVVASGVDYGSIVLCLGVLTVVGVFSFAIAAVTTTVATPTGRVLAQLVIFAVLTVPVTVWLAGWEASPGGATPGKRLLGLRVLTVSGDRLTWPRSLLRTALKFTVPWELAHTAWWNLLLRSGDHGAVLDAVPLSLVCAAIAVYLVSLFVGSRRAPYDRITGTFVTASKRRDLVTSTKTPY